MDNMEMNSGNAVALPVDYMLHERYKIGNVLGAGGFGITYKAFDTLNKLYCAVKEYVPLGICMRLEDRIRLRAVNSEMSAHYNHGKKRFMEEAAVLLEVASIPNIVRITDFFEGNGTAYYVMEYLQGSTVKQLQRIMPNKIIPFEEAVRIINVVGMALDKVHSQRFLLHRDISPDNIFITNDEKIKLIDFGSAKHVSGQGNQVFSVVLKPRFAPPEQYRKDSKQGNYTDVYALASTFYYMICGQMLPDSMERMAGAEYIPAYKLVPQMSRPMSAVLDKALHLDFKKRYQTVGRFLRELEEARRQSEDNARCFENTKEYRPYVGWNKDGKEIKRWYIPEDVMIGIGREEGKSQIVINMYREVSKLHCYIQFDGESKKFLLKDMSTNGTYVGKKTLKKEQVYVLNVGSVLKLAGICEVSLGVAYESKRQSG